MPAALLAAVAVLAAAGGCAAATAGGPQPAPPVPAPARAELGRADVDAWLDGLVPAAMDRAGIAGGVVSVVQDGRVLTARGYGDARLGPDRAPVDPDRTLFRVGSVSKVLTATAVLQLAGQGRIDLDADVRRYLDFDLPQRFDTPITMRHLLTHTAGFEGRIRGLIAFDDRPADLRTALATDPPEQVFAPGSTPAYSNYGYGLAGYVVERVAGIPFEDYVQRNVIDRAGMDSASFAQPLPGGLRERLSDAFTGSDGPPMPFETISPAPAGSLAASATDMARFATALLDGRLLDPATGALMQRPGLDASALGELAQGPRMALGLFDESRNGTRILGHGGDTDFFHSHLQLYPDSRTAVFVSLNSSGTGGSDTLDLRNAVLEGFADRYFPAASPPAAAAAAAPDGAAALAGTYEAARAPFSTFTSALSLTGQTTVTPRPDGTVVISPGPASVHPAAYEQVRPGVWREIGGQRTLSTRTADGRVEAIGYESAFTLLRIGSARDAGTAVPVLVGSVLLLVASLLAWPLGAVARRRYRAAAPAPLGRTDRILHGLTRGAVVAALVALAGWAASIATIASLGEVPFAVLQVLQVAQWAALLGVVPALLGVGSAVRAGAGRGRVAGRVVQLVALAGTGWIAVAFGLLSSSLSY
ncbi:serine hydrolase domain-containing protein [Pseudonocardia sp. HH130630-07]|uniref:serine hydrolase domain-containing protein n=1 Tax=Pseudonocardia sp. HH130630-07 TaxID=1690815 RepID=UPI0018D39A80|nr:serine hydrolase domain-containing protein [Pseudonocardia sp. HH130630-07]